jgi:hypothetical protein
MRSEPFRNQYNDVKINAAPSVWRQIMRRVQLFNRTPWRRVWIRISGCVRIAALSGIALCASGVPWPHHPATVMSEPVAPPLTSPGLASIRLPPPWSDEGLPADPCAGPGACAFGPAPLVLFPEDVPPGSASRGGGDDLAPASAEPATVLATNSQRNALAEPGSVFTLTFGWLVLALVRRRRPG